MYTYIYVCAMCIYMTLPVIICVRGELFLLTPVKDLRSEELKQSFSCSLLALDH